MSLVCFHLPKDLSLSASLITQLRKVTNFSISEIRSRVINEEPLIQITPFSNSWNEDRSKLVEIVNHIKSAAIPFSISELTDDGTATPVSTEMLENLLSHFRDIELETQRNTMLELGEIDDPSEFEPDDADWTQ
ncbi:hypothetical protein GC163_22020 [bacterium]|nr:hypothetical protein [bacterium]